MATVKVGWRAEESKEKEMPAQKYEEYLEKDRGTEMFFSSHNCTQGNIIADFIETQKFNEQYNKRSKNIAFEVIHSFDKEESQKLGGKKINELGQELAKRYFKKGHQFAVYTHTDTDHIHNHILVNPVSHETGKRELHDKKIHLDKLRGISNQISVEQGLSVIKKDGQEQGPKVSQKVQEIKRRRGQSYQLDFYQKANFARSYSTSFDEYVGILNEMSVKTAITNKNITYYYEGVEKGTRGKTLGKRYDKEKLIQKFKENDELFSIFPQLRSKILDGINDFKAGKRDDVGVSSSILLGRKTTQDIERKDYKAFTKSNRRGDRTPIPSDSKLRDSLIPINEIRKASQADILEYCDKNKINYKKNTKGETVLDRREFVTIDGNRWTNTKNNTTGSLIEFVAAHDKTSFLGAIAKITDNKNLLLFEQYFGEVEKKYTSFHIPKEKQLKDSLAFKKVDEFLKENGLSSQKAQDLFKSKKVQVDKKGSIWFFNDGNQNEALEFYPNNKGGYNQKRHGNQKSPFAQNYKNQKSLTLFTDIFSFLEAKTKQAYKGNRQKPHLALMGTEDKALHLFLSDKPQIKSIDIVESKNKDLHKAQSNYINKLRTNLKSFGISVNSISFEKSLTRNRSIDFDF
jgi:hypothetical protein